MVSPFDADIVVDVGRPDEKQVSQADRGEEEVGDAEASSETSRSRNSIRRVTHKEGSHGLDIHIDLRILPQEVPKDIKVLTGEDGDDQGLNVFDNVRWVTDQIE